MGNLRLLEKQLCALINQDDFSLYDALKTYNIEFSMTYDLSYSVLGFVYYSRLGNYHLIINGNLSLATQQKTFIHEIKHIINDMPTAGFIIGLDMMYTPLEIEADEIAETVLSYG